jgi:bacterioferritin
MGKTGTKIIKVNVDQLIKKLTEAYADEWLAYYQYWVGAKVAVGMMRPEVVEELMEHASDELRHADMIAERLIQLGADPILEPKGWYDLSGCGYLIPSDPKTKTLVEQNIEGERCAIKVYAALLDFVQGKDSVTEAMVREILADEVEHEDDLEAIIQDMKR